MASNAHYSHYEVKSNGVSVEFTPIQNTAMHVFNSCTTQGTSEVEYFAIKSNGRKVCLARSLRFGKSPSVTTYVEVTNV